MTQPTISRCEKVFFTFVIIFFSAVSAQANSSTTRDEIINKKLNCIAQNYSENQDFHWADICYTDVPTPLGSERDSLIERDIQNAARRAEYQGREQTQEQFREFEDKVSGDIDDIKTKFEENAQMQKVDVPLQERNLPTEDYSLDARGYNSFAESPHQFEVGTEIYSYKYTERIGVKDTGIKYGLTGAYQYRFSENESIYTWNDFLHATNKLNIFRLEARASYGEVDYEGSGTWDNIPDWNFETRGLLGLEIPVRDWAIITPFAGLGYRYLFNEFSVVPSQNIGGQQYYSGYDRESTYIYIPLGVETKKEFDENWSLSFINEVDFFIWGKQITHLEDSADQNGVSAGYDELENKQEKGFGWRTSARLTKRMDRFEVFIEPFFRYWHIEDSEFSFVTAGGALLCTGNLCSGGIEPDNKTWEYGVNMGAKF